MHLSLDNHKNLTELNPLLPIPNLWIGQNDTENATAERLDPTGPIQADKPERA